mgnify:FL=1
MKKLIFFIFLFCSNLLTSEDFLIKSKGYLDIQTGDIIKADLLIRNGKIAEIGKINTKDATVISIPDLILIPGLMDSHVHIVGNDSKGEE